MPKSSKIQTVKYAPPPTELPVYGRVDPNQTSFIGRTNYVAALEEKKFVFGIKRGDRKQHLYVGGKSGVGKSKFLELLIRQDIAYGQGVCLIDPGGDLIDSILDFIPEERTKDVVLIDPLDKEFTPAFNFLSGFHPECHHNLTKGFLEAFENLFGKNWTPELEHLLRFTILSLLESSNSTIGEIIPFINEPEHRKKRLEEVKNLVVKSFWEVDFPRRFLKLHASAIAELSGKLSQIFSNPIFKSIFDQKEGKFDFKDLISGKKIVLINLPIAKLGEENVSFFGSLILSCIEQAVATQFLFSEKSQEGFYLYIEKFDKFLTNQFLGFLPEAKKSGFCITLSQEHISQLNQKSRLGILNNIGTFVIFKLGGEDASFLESEMEPVFKAKDMTALSSQQFYIKLTINGEVYDPFSAESLRVLPPSHQSFRGEIVNFSREKYSNRVYN